MEYLFIYKYLYVAIIYVHFVEVNIAIVEINYGHQKIGFLIGHSIPILRLKTVMYGIKTFYLVFIKLRKSSTGKTFMFTIIGMNT